MNLTLFSKGITKCKRSHDPKYIKIINKSQISGNGELLFPLIKSNYIWLQKIVIIILSFTALTFGCTKEKKENKLSLKYQKCVLGGCYINTKSTETDQQDTVMFSIVNDTLILYYGLHHNCCGKLTNTVKTNENKITIEVVNKSTKDCLCNCLCYYSSDFKFTNFQTGTYTYKVLVKDYLGTDFKIFKEGSVYVIKQ